MKYRWVRRRPAHRPPHPGAAVIQNGFGYLIEVVSTTCSCGCRVFTTSNHLNGTSGTGVDATLERHLDLDVEDLSKSIRRFGQSAINELVSKVAEVEEQRPPLDPRPHVQRTVVLRPLARHLDLVRTRPAQAHHQVKLRRGRRGIGARAGKAPRQPPMHLDHRRIGSQYVTEPLQHTAIAHITRREFPHQLREHCSKHPCEAGSEPVIERRGDQRLARRTLAAGLNFRVKMECETLTFLNLFRLSAIQMPVSPACVR